jgi:hypothetical protein
MGQAHSDAMSRSIRREIESMPESRLDRLEPTVKDMQLNLLELQVRIKHLEDLLTPPSCSTKTALVHRHSYLYQEGDKPLNPTDT